MWSMKADRELIELAKTKTLEAIADQFRLPPGSPNLPPIKARKRPGR
jgi:hypothetical protein